MRLYERVRERVAASKGSFTVATDKGEHQARHVVVRPGSSTCPTG